MAINQQDYYYFYQVAQTLSFTQTAEKLHCSKSHISKAISRLEAQLQTKLFQRNTRQLILTQAGEQLFETVAHMQATLDSGLDALQHLNDAPMGNIKISAPPAFSESLLAPLLMDFLKIYPQITLQLDCNNRFVDMIEDGYDVVFRSAVLSDSSLIAHELLTIQYLCVTTDRAMAARIQSPKDLTKVPCIAYDSGKVFQWDFEKDAQKITIPIKPILSTNLSTMIKACVMQGHCVGALPSFMVNDAIKQKKLYPVLQDWGIQNNPVYMVYPSRHYMPLKLKRFIQFIKQACKGLG